MSLSIYDTTVPVFTRMLTNLLVFLDKAEADAAARKYSTDVLVDARLAPDMIPFRGQVMIATDHVKGCVSRLAGQPVPSWPDEEKTFDELRARVQKALDLLATITPEALSGGETRDVTLKMRTGEVTMNGLDYVNQRALPNFYFHITTAYAILRHNGVPLGKSDFIG
ncbi:DUF1993 domain-containing protein [Devosia rhizoryzae]|uniref:DUF1993 domain-containing protein n=1 Tax=Devosia rhizoryzae TaxID=2774137 RepID=A0ABX7CA58_9HYPH|nr:DUF1993 domain-containing protein [Devosia rhizoryzae]QQR40663.1 DUF1993 domain-containing protein [Devosia rhizoryzae]